MITCKICFSAGSSRSATPTPGLEGAKKRKMTSSELAVAAAKKAKLDQSSTPSGGGANTSSLYRYYFETFLAFEKLNKNRILNFFFIFL